MNVSIVDRKREALKKAYKNRKWWTRVNRMQDSQVVAIYMRLKKQHKI